MACRQRELTFGMRIRRAGGGRGDRCLQAARFVTDTAFTHKDEYAPVTEPADALDLGSVTTVVKIQIC